MKYNRVPLNYSTLICFNRAFHYKPSSYWGTPIYGNLDAVLKPLPSTRTYAITSQRPPGQTPWIITRKAWENHGFVWKKNDDAQFLELGLMLVDVFVLNVG